MDLMDLTQWNASRANVDASGAGAKIPWDERTSAAECSNSI